MAPARLEAAWRTGRFIAVVGDELLEELRDVLSRPRVARRHGRPPEDVLAFVAALGLRSANVRIPGAIHLCRDPDDDALIETATAAAGRADYLVTGDADLRAPEVAEFLAGYECRVVTVAEFLAALALELAQHTDGT